MIGQNPLARDAHGLGWSTWVQRLTSAATLLFGFGLGAVLSIEWKEAAILFALAFVCREAAVHIYANQATRELAQLRAMIASVGAHRSKSS